MRGFCCCANIESDDRLFTSLPACVDAWCPRYFTIDSAAAAAALLEAGAPDAQTNKATGKLVLGGGPVKAWPMSQAMDRKLKINPGKRERNSASTFRITQRP